MTATACMSSLRRPIPGEPHISWLDLLEQISLEHRVDVLDILGCGREAAVVLARHHYWAALSGAGYSPQEIARALGVSGGNVKTSLTGARAERIRRFIAEQPGFYAISRRGPAQVSA